LITAGGCAKKKPPEPAPAPPQPTETAPTPTPTPTPEPPAPAPPTPSVRSEDFAPAFFDLDSYSLRDDARSALDGNARLMRSNPTIQVTIEGHCDERGTVEYNQALGERRALAARDYMVSQGVEGNRMQVISYGKERPFSTGADETAWSQNRRAHFVVR
jgi:peptidoglycan-associated lipoprotein